MASNNDIYTYNKEDICPICLDTYRGPKLLPCRHTFCTVCLEKLVKTDDPNSNCELNCPCCRTKHRLQMRGVSGYPNNYFVRDTTSQEHSKATDGCFDPIEQHTDVLCSDDLEEDGESFKETRLIDEQQWTRPRVLRFPRDRTKTHHHCAFLCSIAFEWSQKVTCLCPISRGFCLAVTDYSNVINKIDSKYGQVVYQYHVMPSVNIHDIVVKDEGCLLLLASAVGRILSYQTRSNTYTTFISLVDFRGSHMALMSDGRLAISGVNTSGSSSIMDEFGQLLLFSNDGTLLKKIGDEYMSFQPGCISINAFENRICITDVNRNLVSVLRADGSHINDFTGRTNERKVLRSVLGAAWPRSNVTPKGLCCDAEGNILVVDEETCSIFFLDWDGFFRGFIVLEDREGEELYKPFHIAYDSMGTLWVEDRVRRRVNVYRTSQFINVLVKHTSE
ncbi:uncharacterized protein [Argopecten irradians]|uniref:uncharacterized protein n=1 Tax=Argopecten irradians TaxID=31199 RepID=UPI0037226D35